jgi:hypothetical protein
VWQQEECENGDADPAMFATVSSDIDGIGFLKRNYISSVVTVFD